jgi:hypothetical protein
LVFHDHIYFRRQLILQTRCKKPFYELPSRCNSNQSLKTTSF